MLRPMKTFCKLILLLLPCGLASAADLPFARAESAFLGKRYECVLTESYLTNAPTWDAEKTPPPLSPKQAASVARSALLSQFGNHPSYPPANTEPGWLATQIALVKGGDFGPREFWYYKIGLIPMSPDMSNAPPLTVFVAMSGRVAPLKEIPKNP